MNINPSSLTIPVGFSYRKADNRDTASITSIVTSVLKEYKLPVELESTDSDLLDVETHYKSGYFGVLLKNDDIVATYGLYPLNTREVEIRKMYALPSVRGKGLGKWMVNHLIQISKENDYHYIYLETSTLLVEAMGLYTHMGFKEALCENKTPRCDKSFKLKIS